MSAPASGYATNATSLGLSWNAVAYGHTYQIQIDDSSTFTTPNYTYTSDVDALSDVVGPLLIGNWYWRVRALNINSVPGSWSTSRYFRIYPSFNAQFNNDGNFEGWEQHPGAPWDVSAGSLQTSGVDGTHTSSASYAGATFTDFTYEARIKMDYDYSGPNDQIDNVYGLLLRGTPNFDADWNDWQNGYYFLIGQYYDAATDYDGTCYNVFKISNWNWTSLTSTGNWVCYDDINFGDWNTLKVYAKGNTLKFYINDFLELSKTVSGPTSGRLGIVTWRQTGVVEPTYVDWAVAGSPVLPAGIEQVAPSQRVYLPKPTDHFPR